MIGYIKGTVEELEDDCIVLDRDGIGFRIFTTASVIGGGYGRGTELKLYTYLSVKEDALQLYGFLTREELRIFKLLLTVSGVGPKGALGVLSALRVDELTFAVLSDDAAAVAKAPGIGKKTAQKVILELKDKLSLEEAFETKLGRTQEEAAAAGSGEAENEAVQALVALGYSGSEALQAVRKAAQPGMDSEQILKAALRYLF